MINLLEQLGRLFNKDLENPKHIYTSIIKIFKHLSFTIDSLCITVDNEVEIEFFCKKQFKSVIAIYKFDPNYNVWEVINYWVN